MYYAPWIAIFAIIGIVYGALVAMVQPDMKKLVAYSSVSHLGFVMLGLFALNGPGLNGSVGMVAAYTSVRPMPGWWVKRWPPHLLHHMRELCGVLLKVETYCDPSTIVSASGFHSVKAFTGPADQRRHDSQWQ